MCRIVHVAADALAARGTRRPEPALPRRLVRSARRKWHVTGTVVGRLLDHACDADWTVNHQFLKVHFLDVSKAAPRGNRPPVPYEAFVFIGYDNMSERYVVHRLDVFGGRFSETLGYRTRPTANSIKFMFEYPDRPLHNTFAWHGDHGTWSILIRQKDARGHWTTFAEELLTRAKTSD